MIRAAVVERSKDKREYLIGALESMNLNDIHVKDFANEYDFREAMDDGCTSFDMLFVNTTITREGDGVALASFVRKRNQNMMICFVTETDRYYKEAFLVFATGYILYPFDVSELYNVVSYHCRKSVQERRATWMIKETGGHYKRLFCRNILYIESRNREITVHLEDGTTMDSYAKLNKAEEELPKGQFLRCHQSYIVNLYFVESMEREAFHLAVGDIPISRKFQASAKESYYDYMFQKV